MCVRERQRERERKREREREREREILEQCKNIVQQYILINVYVLVREIKETRYLVVSFYL